MLKVRIIKPKVLKIKAKGVFPDILDIRLQEKEITPSGEIQEITPDREYNGLSKVVVNEIPNEYIIPSGSLDVTENGTYDVTTKASVNVEIPTKTLGAKTITTNGTYLASDDDLDGYSIVEVATSGVDINDYFDTTPSANTKMASTIKQVPYIDTSSYTNMSSMFENFKSLESMPQLNTSSVRNMSRMFYHCNELKEILITDTSKVTDMNSMFWHCYKIKTIPSFDTSLVTNMSSMFYSCDELENLPLLDCSKVTQVNQIIDNCNVLTTLGGFKDLGKAYTQKSNNYYAYRLSITQDTVTHESLMNVINNLYDLNIAYDVANGGTLYRQTLNLGSTNKAKLTAEEIAIAEAKGWNVS